MTKEIAAIIMSDFESYVSLCHPSLYTRTFAHYNPKRKKLAIASIANISGYRKPARIVNWTSKEVDTAFITNLELFLREREEFPSLPAPDSPVVQVVKEIEREEKAFADHYPDAGAW